MNEIEFFEKNNNIKDFRIKELFRRTEHLKNAQKQNLIFNNTINRNKLHITYVMTWTGICGGSKIILQHANKLIEKGHNLTIISHYPYPSWFPINKNINFIQVPLEQILCESIPTNSDLIVTTYWREIYEAIEQKIAPVIYFEQGDFHLFDSSNVDKKLFNYIYKQINLASFVFTVSTYAQKKLKEVYNVESTIIPNAINNDIFFPSTNKNNSKLEITMIGNPNIEFKRIPDILKALETIKQRNYNININLITPEIPEKNFNIIDNLIINPEQQIIGQTLRKTDIFICASKYESFCLPVLEALSCGCAVITTDNGGINDFCKNNFNCLFIEKENITDITQKTIFLIENKNTRDKLSKNAIKISKNFSWENIINNLEKYYINISKFEIHNQIKKDELLCIK